MLGGNGYINDYPTGRILRDAQLYRVGAGTQEIRRRARLWESLRTRRTASLTLLTCRSGCSLVASSTRTLVSRVKGERNAELVARERLERVSEALRDNAETASQKIKLYHYNSAPLFDPSLKRLPVGETGAHDTKAEPSRRRGRGRGARPREGGSRSAVGVFETMLQPALKAVSSSAALSWSGDRTPLGSPPRAC